MVTLESTLRKIHEWSIDRMHTMLDECTKDEFIDVVEDAHAIHEEFAEWLDPNKKGSRCNFTRIHRRGRWRNHLKFSRERFLKESNI